MQVIAPPSILPAKPAKDLGPGSSQEIGRNSIPMELFEFCMARWMDGIYGQVFGRNMDKQDALMWLSVEQKFSGRAPWASTRTSASCCDPSDILRAGSGRSAVRKPDSGRSCRSAWTGSGSWPRSAVRRSPRASCPRWPWPQSGGTLYGMENEVGSAYGSPKEAL